MEGFELIPEMECWERYGWGSGAAPGSLVMHGRFDGKPGSGGYEVFVDEMADKSYGGVYGCEVYDGEGCDMLGQWFDETPEDAVRGAMVEAVGYDVLRVEDNCEDAVNGCAYEAYMAVHGDVPLNEADRDEMDELLGYARRFVSEKCGWYGIEWEEF